MDKKSNIYCGQKTWLEGPAVEQFKRVMTFPGIIQGAAFPDLHPGRGVPVGAAFLSEKVIYPALIGNDIGCGMTLLPPASRNTSSKKTNFSADLEVRWKLLCNQPLLNCLIL